MKYVREVCKRALAVMLLVSLLFPYVPTAEIKADTTVEGENNGQTEEISVTEERKLEILKKNGLADTQDSVKGKDNGRNPLTGQNDVMVSVNPSYELLVGEAGVFDSSQKRQKWTQTVYDLESQKKFTEKNGTVVKEKNESANTNGEIITAVRTTAFDPFGEGKEHYIAELMAVHSQSVALEDFEKGKDYLFADGTLIYLNIYDAGNQSSYIRSIAIGYLRFDIEEWQADAYMQISAGDYDGDGCDELAVYCPTDTSKTSNDMSLLTTASYVTLYKAYWQGVEETRTLEIEELLTENERYYLNVTDRDSNHDKQSKDMFKNTIDEICAVDLETIRHPNNTKDSLAIATCPPRNGTKVTSSFDAETRVDIWLDATKAPGASNLSKHSMRWDLNNYQSTKWKPGKEYDVMFYGGLSAGDLDNDGHDELVVAGYRIRNTSDSKGWKLDNRYLFIERLTPYSDAGGYGYKNSGNVPQMINVVDGGGSWLYGIGGYGTENKPTSIDRKVLSPLSVECYRGRGKDFADIIFLGGDVYEWKADYSANYVRKNTAHAKSEGGYKRLAITYSDDLNKDTTEAKKHKEVLTYAVTTGHICFTNTVSGNFDNNPYGIEQLYTVMNYMSGKSAGASILGISQKNVGEYDSKCSGNFNLKKVVNKGSCMALSLCAPDVDDDATRVSYTSQEVYYANPQPVAILQAPPYFSEKAEVDSDYLSTGSTAFTVGEGGGDSETHSFSVTAGVIVGAEQSISLLGLFKTGISAMAEVSGGAGYEQTKQATSTFSTTYNATKEDQVVTLAVPYVRYRYKVQNPSLTTLSLAELTKLDITIMKLRSSKTKASEKDKQKIDAAITMMSEYWENQKELIKKYGYSKTLKNEVVEMTYSQPGTPAMTMLSKNEYNKMVQSMGMTDYVIEDDVLHNASPGDVASYIWNTSSDNAEYTWAGDYQNISAGAAGSCITQEIAKEQVSEKSITWNAGLHKECTISVGGLTAGLSYSLEYNGANAEITMNSTTASGTVACIPNVDAGKSLSDEDGTGYNDVKVRDKYAFKSRVGTWLTSIGGNDCRVVGYEVKRMVDNQKFPPKPVEDIEVEAVYNTNGDYSGIRVRWYPVEESNAACYSTPVAYKTWIVGASVTKRAVMASDAQQDENGRTYYEVTYTQEAAKLNTAIAVAVRPVELSDDYACYTNPIYIMEQDAYDAIFTRQPENVTYEAATVNADGETQFSGEVKLSGDNLTFDYVKTRVKWQFYSPATRVWKEVFEQDENVGRKVAKELEEYGITEAADSLSSSDNIRKTPGTATLDIKYSKIPVDVKFRLCVAYSVGNTEGFYNAYSNEAGFVLKTTNTGNASMSASEDGITFGATTENGETGSVIAGKVRNLSNNSASRDVLLLPGNLVTMITTPGVYQLETVDTISSTGSVVSNRIAYYGDREQLLATTAVKQQMQRLARGVNGVNADIDTITYGEALLLNTELYNRKAEDPNVPQSAEGITYRVLSNAEGIDVTDKCMNGNVFTPNSAGEFLISAKLDASEQTLATNKIVHVEASRDRYEPEVLEEVLSTGIKDITGVVYGCEKSSDAFGLPKTAQVKTTSGSIYDAEISWDVENCAYNSSSITEQTFVVNGNVSLPDKVNNVNNVPTAVSVTVTVNEEPLVISVPVDNMPPTVTLKGTITIGNKTYSDYKENIAFNTEFSGAQKVLIAGTDERDDVVSVSYLKSDYSLSMAQLEEQTAWKSGNEVTLAEGEKCIIYAKVMNFSGDTIYLSTDGIIVKKVEQVNTDKPQNDTKKNNKKVVKVGKTYTIKKIKYKVTANGKNKKVQVTGTTNKNLKTLTIPSTVKILGQSYKVTSVKAEAFKNKKKLTKVILGKNVTTIGKKAFYGCKKLKTIQIKSTGLKKNSIGKNAFYKISGKPKFKVPAKKLKNYKKYITKSKVAKKAKITK